MEKPLYHSPQSPSPYQYHSILGGGLGYPGSVNLSSEIPPEPSSAVAGINEPPHGVLRDTSHHLFPSGNHNGEIYEAPDSHSLKIIAGDR
jgi:hypothetical protein